MEAQPEVIADRAHALMTCPAQAPSPWAASDADKRSRAGSRQHELDPVIQAVEAQLDLLPDEQGGQWWLDPQNHRLVVQVTRDAESILSELRALIEDPSSIAVELVRYSGAELDEWAQRIIAMDDLGWSSVGFENPNNRIEVQVRGDAAAAWQLITRVVEPCAVRVEGGIEIRPLPRSR